MDAVLWRRDPLSRSSGVISMLWCCNWFPPAILPSKRGPSDLLGSKVMDVVQYAHDNPEEQTPLLGNTIEVHLVF
jgi:hypothetical protein